MFTAEPMSEVLEDVADVPAESVEEETEESMGAITLLYARC